MPDEQDDLSDLDADSVFAIVRTARPSPPAGFAAKVLARGSARPRARAVALGLGVAVAAAAAVVIAVAIRPHAPAPAPVPALGLAPVPAVPVPAPPLPPVDAMPPAPPSWTTLSRLVASIAAEHGDAIAACKPRTPTPVCGGNILGDRHTVFVIRQPDGHAAAELQLTHSIGYCGFTTEERCLQAAIAAIEFPAMPDALFLVALRVGGTRPPSDPIDDPWRDPVATAERLLAGQATALEACLASHEARYVIVRFDLEHGAPRAWVPGQAAHSKAELACFARVVRGLIVPPLPAWVTAIEIEHKVGH